MAARKELRCLICHTRIIHSHMGIDACRACGVFFRRSIKLDYSLQCTCGGRDFSNGGKAIISCRKCRFERFHDVLWMATISNAPEIRDVQKEDPSNSTGGIERLCVQDSSPSFIDHRSDFTFDALNSDTPLLDKMKQTYITVCQDPKSHETGVWYPPNHEHLKTDNVVLSS